jgi:hypothetical protein
MVQRVNYGKRGRAIPPSPSGGCLKEFDIVIVLEDHALDLVFGEGGFAPFQIVDRVFVGFPIHDIGKMTSPYRGITVEGVGLHPLPLLVAPLCDFRWLEGKDGNATVIAVIPGIAHLFGDRCQSDFLGRGKDTDIVAPLLIVTSDEMDPNDVGIDVGHGHILLTQG